MFYQLLDWKVKSWIQATELGKSSPGTGSNLGSEWEHHTSISLAQIPQNNVYPKMRRKGKMWSNKPADKVQSGYQKYHVFCHNTHQFPPQSSQGKYRCALYARNMTPQRSRNLAARPAVTTFIVAGSSGRHEIEPAHGVSLGLNPLFGASPGHDLTPQDPELVVQDEISFFLLGTFQK